MLVEIYKRYRAKPIGFIIFIFAILLACCPFFDESKKYPPIIVAIISLMGFIIVVWYSHIFFKDHRIPRARANSLGIIILVNSEDESTYDDTNSKLVKVFCSYLQRNSINKCFVSIMPYPISKKIAEYSNEKISSLLEKKGYKFLVEVTVKSSSDNQGTYYDMSIDLAIRHKVYSPEIERLFWNEFHDLSANIKHPNYDTKNKIQVLHMTAEGLAYMCQYSLSISLCLDGNFKQGAELLDSIFESIKTMPRNPTTASISNYIQKWGYLVHIYISNGYMITHYSCEYDDNSLSEIYKHLQKANDYIKDMYGYNLNMAYYHIMKDRNITEAEKCISKCKERPENQTWRYSDAFLCAYKNQNGIQIYKKYISCFTHSEYEINLIITFIDSIMKTDTNIPGLYLAQTLLYAENQQLELAQVYYSEYIRMIGREKLQNQLVIAISKRYENRIQCI